MVNEIEQNPWCCEHQGKQKKSCERCFAYIKNSKSNITCQIPLFAFNGRKVASLWGNVLVKMVKGTKHMLHHPIGWACDSLVVKTAKSMGAEWFHIFDKESNTVYESSIENFITNGFEINRGYGDQIVLALHLWEVLEPEKISSK